MEDPQDLTKDVLSKEQLQSRNEALGLPSDFDVKNILDSKNHTYNNTPHGILSIEQSIGNPIIGPNIGRPGRVANDGKRAILDNSDQVIADRNALLQSTSLNKNPYKLMQPYSYNGDYDGYNFNKYYKSDAYSKLGFSPYRDNDTLYNNNSTFGDEFARATGSWAKLVGTGFVSGITTWGDIVKGNVLDPDLITARAMKRHMAEGSSTKGGMTSFVLNNFVNSGHSIGVGIEWLAEELALAKLTAFSAGTLAPETLPAMGLSAAKFWRGLASGGLRGIRDTYKTGKATLKAYRGLQTTAELRNFWNSTRTGRFLAATGRVVNPLGGTIDAFRGVKYADKAYRATAGINVAGAFIGDMLDIKGAIAESKLEGGLTQIDVEQKLIEQYRAQNGGRSPEGEDLQNIHDIAVDEGHRDALWNVPIILLSNKIMYETIFKHLKKPKIRQGDAMVDESGAFTVFTKKGFKTFKGTMGETIGRYARAAIKPRTYGKFLKGYAQHNVAEGLQENFQDAIAGASLDNAIRTFNAKDRGAYESFVGDVWTNLKGQVSLKGAETFASGFVMGAMSTPIMVAPTWFGNKVWDNTAGKKDYQAYKKARYESLKRTADYLNDMYGNTFKYFAPEMRNAVAQGHLAKSLYEAHYGENFKDVKDAQAYARVEAIYTALRTGNYDVMVDKFKEMQNMTPEEMEQHQGLQPGEGKKALEIMNDFLKRAEEVKTRYESAPDNPYDFSQFKEGSERREAMEYAWHGFEETRRALIFGQATFDNNVRRLRDMVNAVSSSAKPLENVDASHVTNIMSPADAEREISLLASEIDTMEKAKDTLTDESKKDLAYKKKYLEHLMKLESNLKQAEFAYDEEQYNAYKEELKKAGLDLDTAAPKRDEYGNWEVGTVVHDTRKGLEDENSVSKVVESDTTGYLLENGEFVERDNIEPISGKYLKEYLQVDATEGAREAYREFLNFIANENNDLVFNEKLEDSFQLLLDFRAKNKENINLVRYINYLNDPRGMLEVSARIAKGLSKLHKERRKGTINRMSATVKDYEFNRGIQSLYKDGWFTDKQEFVNLYNAIRLDQKELPVPSVFIQVSTGDTFKVGTPQYDQALEVWNNHVPAIVDDFKTQIAEEEAKQTVTPTEQPQEQPTEEPVKSEMVTPDTPYSEYPEELKKQLEPAYQKYLTDNNITPEEATEDMRESWLSSVSASRIITKWNKDTQKKEMEQKLLGTRRKASEPPVLTTVPLVKGKTLNDFSIQELEKMLTTLKASQKKEASPDKEEDIKALEKYIGYRKGIAVTTPGTEAQKKAMDNLKAIQSEIINKDSEDKAYLIQNNAYERATSVARIMLETLYNYKRPLFSNYNRSKLLLQVANAVILKNGTPKEFMDALRSSAVKGIVLEKYNERKLKLIETYLNENGLTEENVMYIFDKYQNEHTTIRGNHIDKHIREFFATGSLGQRPSYFTEESWDALDKILNELRNTFQQKGYTVVANDLTVFDDEALVAGTLDLLVITPKGEYIIYDIKTGNEDKWAKYENPQGAMPHSDDMMENTFQLSIYKRLLENQTGADVKALGILPIEITEDLDGNILSLDAPRKDKAGVSERIRINYDARVEELIPIKQAKPVAKQEVVSEEEPSVLVSAEAKVKYFRSQINRINKVQGQIVNRINDIEKELDKDSEELARSRTTLLDLQTFLDKASPKELKGKKTKIKQEIKRLQDRITILEKAHTTLMQQQTKLANTSKRLYALNNTVLDAIDELSKKDLATVKVEKQSIQEYIMDSVNKIKKVLNDRASRLAQQIDTIEDRILDISTALEKLGMSEALIDLYLQGNFNVRYLEDKLASGTLSENDTNRYKELLRNLNENKDFRTTFKKLTRDLSKNYIERAKLQFEHSQIMSEMTDVVPVSQMNTLLDSLNNALIAVEELETFEAAKKPPVKPGEKPAPSKPQVTPVSKKSTPTKTETKPTPTVDLSGYVGKRYQAAKFPELTYLVIGISEDGKIIAQRSDNQMRYWAPEWIESQKTADDPDLYEIKDEDEEAPYFVEKPTQTPVSNRADIERRRQEELDTNTSAGYGVIASDYLFTGGRGSMLSTDYLLQALTASFPFAGKQIDIIRNKYASKLGNILDDINGKSYNDAINEIRNAINITYQNAEIEALFDEILNNSTGFVSREGNRVSSRLEALNDEHQSKINAKYDAELTALKGKPTTDQGTLTFTDNNPELIINGKKQLTNRKTPINDGVYTIQRKEGEEYIPTNIQVKISRLGKAMVNREGVVPEIRIEGNHVDVLKARGIPSTFVSATNSTVIDADTYAVSEGFKDWKDFEANNKYSKNFIKGTQSRDIYTIEPVKKPTAPKVQITPTKRSAEEVNALRAQTGLSKAIIEKLTDEEFELAKTFTSPEDAIELIEKYHVPIPKEVITLEQSKEMIDSALSLSELKDVYSKLLRAASFNKLDDAMEVQDYYQQKLTDRMENPVAEDLTVGTLVEIDGNIFKVTKAGKTISLKQLGGDITLNIPAAETSMTINRIIDPKSMEEEPTPETSVTEDDVKVSEESKGNFDDASKDDDALSKSEENSKKSDSVTRKTKLFNNSKLC